MDWFSLFTFFFGLIFGVGTTLFGLIFGVATTLFGLLYPRIRAHHWFRWLVIDAEPKEFEYFPMANIRRRYLCVCYGYVTPWGRSDS
jgi:hypothetical protein